MRAVVIFLVAVTICGCAAEEFVLPSSVASSSGSPPMADTASSYDMEMMMLMTNMTQCSSCPYHFGCCPIIVRSPPNEANKSTVIQPVTGWRGNVALIVDWGPKYPWGRACTTGDRGFLVFVNWGDGYVTVDHPPLFGPWQSQPLHQYAKCDRTYGVHVIYCSNPSPGWPGQRCCDSIYRTIDVSYDPYGVRGV